MTDGQWTAARLLSGTACGLVGSYLGQNYVITSWVLWVGTSIGVGGYAVLIWLARMQR